MARKALGRGLRALIPDGNDEGSVSGGAEDAAIADERPGGPDRDPNGGDAGAPGAGDAMRPREALRYLPIHSIVPNTRQPRTDWDSRQLDQLSQSIREKGLLEPIIVRPKGPRFEIVAGERRWRACKLAGWTELPAIVRPLEDRASLETALIENLQRDDLNPVDEARAYQTLMSEFGLTHDEVAQRVSKDRSTITNLVRILRLPQSVLGHVSRGTISLGHARALMGVPEDMRETVAERILDESWSVRDTEQWASKVAQRRGRKGSRRARGPRKDQHILHIEDLLVRHFGTEVHLRLARKGGRLEIRYADDDELSRILEMLGIVVT
ncbi:MAG: ParB/RepB/Spo0J family partition protein [Candidatus Eisenbacteria bacterium]|nr:ParB/RepB/Spo0J family partition protein [Candidatus Eisenbacteria bacterium]